MIGQSACGSCDEKDVAVKGQVGNDWSKCKR